MKNLFLFALLLSPCLSYSLTFDECLKKVTGSSDKIQIVIKNLESSRSDLKSDRSLFLPSVSASYSYQKDFETDQRSNSYRVGVTASYGLFNGFKDYFSYKISKSKMTSAELAYDDELSAIV